VEFVYDSEMPLDLVLTDMEGRVVYKQNGIAATPGVNTVNLNQQLPHGVYFVILQNTEKAVNRKFFY
nr:T9SS type A sorting domain-containing protein [Bacteroidia bacterium]